MAAAGPPAGHCCPPGPPTTETVSASNGIGALISNARPTEALEQAWQQGSARSGCLRLIKHKQRSKKATTASDSAAAFHATPSARRRLNPTDAA